MADGGVIKVDGIDLGMADMLAGDLSRSRRKSLPQGLTASDIECQKQQKREHDVAHGEAAFTVAECGSCSTSTGW